MALNTLVKELVSSSPDENETKWPALVRQKSSALGNDMGVSLKYLNSIENKNKMNKQFAIES